MRTHQTPDNTKSGFPGWGSALGTVVSGSQAELDCNSQHFERNELSEGRGLNVYNYMARVYDPQIGRWWSVDPLTHMQESVSGYQFCYNNPVSFTDPTGLIGIYVDGVKMESHGDMVMAMGMAKSMYLAEGEDKDTGEKSMWLTNKKSRSTPDNSVPDNIRGNLLDEASKNYFVTYTSISDIIYNLTGGNGLEGAKNEKKGYSEMSGPDIKAADVSTAVSMTLELGGNLVSDQKEIMFKARSSAPLMSRINGQTPTIARINMMGKYSRILGRSANIYSVCSDTKEFVNNEITPLRYTYRMSGTAASVFIGSKFGGWYGAIVGSGFVAGEMLYDFGSWYGNNLSRGLADIENEMSKGRLPF